MSYVEGLATHTSPESCAGNDKHCASEALTRESVG